MSDTSYLDWPFFEPRHRELVDGLEGWAQRKLGNLDHAKDVDATCRGLVRELGVGGWLLYAVPAAHVELPDAHEASGTAEAVAAMMERVSDLLKPGNKH